MHQSNRALSETQAGSAFSTRLTFACAVFARRTPRLQPRVIILLKNGMQYWEIQKSALGVKSYWAMPLYPE